MDIRARTILSLIKSIKGADQSIIAGGAVRDSFFDVIPKDFDFFIPDAVFKEVITAVKKEINPKQKPEDDRYIMVSGGTASTAPTFSWNITPTSSLYKGLPEKSEHPDLRDVVDLEFEGIQLQLMSVPHPNDDTFATKVIDRFDFGINMAFYDSGVVIRDTEKFQHDLKKRHMTLYQLYNLSELPKALEKFNRLNAKLGGNWMFQSPRIILVELPKEEVVVSTTAPDMKEEPGMGRWDGGVRPELRVALDNARAQLNRLNNVNAGRILPDPAPVPPRHQINEWADDDGDVNRIPINEFFAQRGRDDDGPQINPAGEIPMQEIRPAGLPLRADAEWIEPEFDDFDDFEADRVVADLDAEIQADIDRNPIILNN